MPTWLNSQKKARLAELALICNVGDAEELAEWRKDQLVPALEHILSNNPTIYSRIPVFDEYYHRRNSPIKRGGFHPRTSSVNTGLAAINGDGLHQRYNSELKPETESSEESTSSPAAAAVGNNANTSFTLSSPSVPVAAASTRPVLPAATRPVVPTVPPYPRSTAMTTSTTINRTPSRLQELQREAPTTAPITASHPPLPPSPAIVTDLIETQTARFNAEVGELWANTRVMEILQQVRVELSSIIGVHLIILMLEFYFLQSHVVQWNYLFTFNTAWGAWAIHYPDVFVYLTGYWLKMLFTWQTMSFWIPLTISWFFNLTLKLKARNGVEYWRPRYRVDPLTFSLAKAVIAWLVFNHGCTCLGLISEQTIDRILVSQPLGSQGLLVASYIGIVIALWDGIQGKKGWQ